MKILIAKVHLLAFVLLFIEPTYGQNIYGGSTAICIATEDSILIGADSKLMHMDAKGKMTDAGTWCKVHQQNNLIYAAAGILRNDSLPYDPIQVISNLTMKDTTLRKKIEAIVIATRKGYKMLVDNAEAQNPRDFKDNILEKTLTTFAFGSFENGKPVIGFLSLKCKKNNKGINYVKDSIIINYQVPSYVAIGHYRPIDSVLRNNPAFLANGRTILDGIIELIRCESKRTPLAVNDKADVIGISTKGIKWDQKFQECD